MARAWHHLPVSAIAVLWNLLLLGDFLGLQLKAPLYMSWLTPDQAAWFAATPSWVLIVWALAVATGLLASILLVSRMATGAFFALSFLAWCAVLVALQVLRDPPLWDVMGDRSLWMIGAAIVLAFLFFLYARWMHARLRH
ncbi:hypothetical protein [Psychromarinibacter sp. S121]|uniref:hypothetical protein n=1 Tax=Psychromarinibacter sp. S121 TaxID=3415127 RepID=UPI003C7A4F1F